MDKGGAGTSRRVVEKYVTSPPTTPPEAAAGAPSPSRKRGQASTGSPPRICVLSRAACRKRKVAFVEVQKEVQRVLDEVLSLNGRGLAFDRNTLLLGAVPEFDSMVVVTLITTLEERFGIAIDDGDIDGSVFESVGSLSDFVTAQLAH